MNTEHQLKSKLAWLVYPKCVKLNQKMVHEQWLQLKMKFLLGLENCYLLGGINLWWWWWGGGGGWANFWLPHSRENPDVDSLHGFWAIWHTDFFECIFYSHHIKRKAFFSKFWNYCNNAWMFFILNNSFQRMVYVFWKRIKILKLRNFKSNYIICYQGVIFFSKFILSEDCTLFDRKCLTVFQELVFSVFFFFSVFFSVKLAKWYIFEKIKKHAFFLYSSLMQRKLTNDSSLATEHNFEASEFWRKTIWRIIWLIKIFKQRHHRHFWPQAPQSLKPPLPEQPLWDMELWENEAYRKSI